MIPKEEKEQRLNLIREFIKQEKRRIEDIINDAFLKIEKLIHES